MTETLQTKLKIESWDEKPYRELPDGSKFARASVTLAEGADGLSEATFEALMYYRPDGTSSYVSIMQITAELAGRSGTFVLRGDGSYDGTAATGESVILEGSGTGKLAGITGSALSSSTHDDYPFMPLTLRYDLG
jgi:Protein of unknown function (DUF3224)